MNQFLKFLSLTLLVGFLFTSCTKDDDTITPTPNTDIARYFKENSKFSLLDSALTKANLYGALNGAEFTILAPNNGAFTTFLNSLGTKSIAATPTVTLEAILKYHVLSSKVLSTSLTPRAYTSTISPSKFGANVNLSLYIKKDASGVRFNNQASVVTADLVATNDIVHEIGAVLDLPTIATFVGADDSLSVLLANAVTITSPNVVNVLSNPSSSLTLFAPNNNAWPFFYSQNNVTNWNAIQASSRSATILTHVVDGINRSSSLIKDQILQTNQANNKLTVFSITPGVIIMANEASGIQNRATVVTADVQGVNGVMHITNRVFRP
jgi:uncharacterized surface protein with fasciclin (FAS1) repeats